MTSMFFKPFTPETLQQAGRTTLDHALKGLRREVSGVTIDGATSRDFDDAIWVTPQADGGYIVNVSIADVSALVDKDSPMDKDAMQRATSLYRQHGVSPMLPGIISDNLLSLRPGETRPTITVTMELNRNLDVVSVELEKTKLASQQRYTYEQATQAMSAPDNSMHAWGKLAQGLLEKRRQQGARAFYDAKSSIYASGDGPSQQLKSDTAPAHILVQELMILANTVVAKTMAEAKIPFPFRNHRASSLSDDGKKVVHTFADFAKHGRPTKRLDHFYERATYDSSPDGHFSLGVPYYTHFTSPIRRYPDLLAHRIVTAFIKGKESPYSKEDLDTILPSVTERIHSERDCKKATLRSYGFTRAAHQSTDASYDTVLALTKGQFSALVRTAAYSGEIGEEPARAIAARIQKGQCSLHDMGEIMTVAPKDHGLWDSLRKTVLLHLQDKPPAAVSLLEICSRLSKNKSTYTIHTLRIGGSNDRPVVASYVEAKTGDRSLVNTVAVRDDNQRHARQQASVEFWEQYVAGTLVTPQQQTRIPQENQSEKQPLVGGSIWNAWHQISSKYGYEQDWRFECVGDHGPWRATLTLTVKGSDIPVTIQAEDRSKPAARLKAAKQAIDDHRLPHHLAQKPPEPDMPGNGKGGGGNTILFARAESGDTRQPPLASRRPLGGESQILKRFGYRNDPLARLQNLAKAHNLRLEWMFNQLQGASWTATLTVTCPHSEPIRLVATAEDQESAKRDAAALALRQSEVVSPRGNGHLNPFFLTPRPSFCEKEGRRERIRQERKHTRDNLGG